MELDPNEPKLGMKIMSMVDAPAIMVNWVKFKDSNQVKFAIDSEEQRIVFAPALIPDMPIYRNVGGKEFYLTIDAPTIQETAIKFAKDNLNNTLDINHDGNIIGDVTIFESFITSENRVQAAKGFEDLPVGTWFISAKVNNDDVWNKIKAGELNGFSIDALFSFAKSETVTDSQAQADIEEILNSINFFKIIE